MVLDFTLQLTFRKLPFIKVLYSVQGEYLQLSEKGIKIILPLLTTHLCEDGFFMHFN